MANILDTSGTKPPRKKIEPARIEFRRLAESCQRGAFSCGYVHIDDFLNNRSLDDHEALFSRTVTAHLDGQAEPVGFYAMTIGAEPADQFVQEEEQSWFASLKTRLLRSQLTTVQLIWVGVETKFHRKGIGTLLMGHALDDFYQVVERTGVSALTLHPISTNAAIFYSSIGFQPYGTGSTKRMLLPADAVMETRRKAAP
ncbi:GNAT family N-acetyltransferase [Bradyrhizobium brasilense]|uniref:GNAT family N-acetyltransferase n=1 Tax=Bradyrhizobium brasilense TaxID=1419277 RepID=UPI00115FDF87